MVAGIIWHIGKSTRQWVYENNLEFDVPTESGFTYDGVVVVWKTNPNDSSAVLPKDMTAEQLAEFKVQCLSS